MARDGKPLVAERLSLYTSTAQGLYASAGWATIETLERDGKTYSIMQKHS